MTVSLRVKVVAISATILGAGALAGALTDVSEAYERFRPWVEAEELKPVLRVAENALKGNRKLRGDFLRMQQDQIDDKRAEFEAKGLQTPKFLKERQKGLDRRKCEYWNELREPEDRQPCF